MSTIDEAPQDRFAKSGPAKAVSIAEPETVSTTSSPRLDGKTSLYDSAHAKQHRATSTRRFLGRPALSESTSSLKSNVSTGSVIGMASPGLHAFENERPSGNKPHLHRHSHEHHSSRIISQVADWLQHEKAKKATRDSKSQPRHSKTLNTPGTQRSSLDDGQSDELLRHNLERRRSSSGASDESMDLERLERILAGAGLGEDAKSTPKDDRKGPHLSRHPSAKHRLLRKSSTVASSDTDYQDGDAVVPSAEVVLDNSKTLGYSGGEAEPQTGLLDSSKRVLKEKEAWTRFKNEIVRLAHTLRLKGWRRVPLDRGGDIDVERLSGALTNAVYVVSPPKHLPQASSDRHGSAASSISGRLPPPPQKLLLRIYGPQVEHLINRESELQILRRLRRKRIGPCLLGTFTNGRFEEFFYADTLTAADLRIPQTSMQIAKRMRELHDGVELLGEEREAGPFVWQNWDKWVDRCEEVISWLDHQILMGKQGLVRSRSEKWKKRGLVCGVEWADFRKAVEWYRAWLNQQFGGIAGIKQQLVFAHNDTQYGNVLRLKPPGESPLLMPANEHKQLIVIDFEYASANVPGLEFANHFTEWCYNYHNSENSYALHATKYPNPEEQHRFLKAYLQHRPLTSPTPTHTQDPSSSASSFVLDSYVPPSQNAEEEAIRDQGVDTEIARFMHEARIWRLANSAQWVAWGIVQAKVPGMDEALKAQESADPASTGTVPAHEKRPEGSAVPISPEGPEIPHAEEDEEQEEDEFDYLGYAQDRAMFFWGDALQLGIVERDNLPASLLEKIKVVEY